MGTRRFALYFAWSRPEEINVDLGVLENRYPTLFEFRRALWPMAEAMRDQAIFAQDIRGFLEHVVLSDFERFRNVIRSITGDEVPVIQREASREEKQCVDDALLKGIDTLIVVSLDHFRTEQEATADEIAMIRSFLSREDRCLVVCPHHVIGCDSRLRQSEFSHHGDRLVPSEQQIGGFARSVLRGLGFSLTHRFGLSPGRSNDGGPAVLEVCADLDACRILEGVKTFNLHPHLPHLECHGDGDHIVSILARQPVNADASTHPFVEAGNRFFNAFLQLSAPNISGKLFVCDATLWSSAFAGLPSLERLWKNLALMN